MSLNLRGQIALSQCFSLSFYINAKDGDSGKKQLYHKCWPSVRHTESGGKVQLLFPLRAILIFSDVHAWYLEEMISPGLVSVLPTLSFWTGLRCSCGKATDLPSVLTGTCLLHIRCVAAGCWLRECKVCLMLCPELNLPWGLFPSHLPQLWPLQFFNMEGMGEQIRTPLLQAQGKSLRKKLQKNAEVFQRPSAPRDHPGSHCSPSYRNKSMLRPMQPNTSSPTADSIKLQRKPQELLRRGQPSLLVPISVWMFQTSEPDSRFWPCMSWKKKSPHQQTLPQKEDSAFQ